MVYLKIQKLKSVYACILTLSRVRRMNDITQQVILKHLSSLMIKAVDIANAGGGPHWSAFVGRRSKIGNRNFTIFQVIKLRIGIGKTMCAMRLFFSTSWKPQNWVSYVNVPFKPSLNDLRCDPPKPQEILTKKMMRSSNYFEFAKFRGNPKHENGHSTNRWGRGGGDRRPKGAKKIWHKLVFPSNFLRCYASNIAVHSPPSPPPPIISLPPCLKLENGT